METEKVVHFLPCKPVGPTEDCKQTKATVCVKLDSVPVFISSTQTCIAHISGARMICLVTFDSCTAMRYIKKLYLQYRHFRSIEVCVLFSGMYLFVRWCLMECRVWA